MPVVVGFVPTPEGLAAVHRAVLECHLHGVRLIVVTSEENSLVPLAVDPPLVEVRAASAELGIAAPDLEIRRIKDPYEPTDELLAVAEETQAELIVIGLRRRSRLGKLILGGRAQRILLDASCPVLAVKENQPIIRPNITRPNVTPGHEPEPEAKPETEEVIDPVREAGPIQDPDSGGRMNRGTA
jgi:nucleotide-binding universal stress UspA family protein